MKVLQKLLIYIFIIFAIFANGCINNVNTLSKKTAIIEKQGLAKAKYLIKEKKYDDALQFLLKTLEQRPNKIKYYFYTAKVYGLLGDIDNASKNYIKCLKQKPDDYNAYFALKNIYSLRLEEINKNIENKKVKLSQLMEQGKSELKTTQKEINQLFHDKANLYLKVGDLYLLCDNLQINFEDFAQVQSYLRDIQDSLKDDSLKLKQENSSLKKIQKMRINTSKKYVFTLISMAAEHQKVGKIKKAIAFLEDANAQIGKFFKEAKPVGHASLLNKDEEIDLLAKKVAKKLYEYYELALQINLRNRQYFKEINNFEKAKHQTKVIRQMIEDMVHIKVQALWRLQKIENEEAVSHFDMIPIYEQILTIESGNKGKYYFLLARCYYKQGNQKKALEYGLKAQEEMDNYMVQDFLKKIRKK